MINAACCRNDECVCLMSLMRCREASTAAADGVRVLSPVSVACTAAISRCAAASVLPSMQLCTGMLRFWALKMAFMVATYLYVTPGVCVYVSAVQTLWPRAHNGCSPYCAGTSSAAPSTSIQGVYLVDSSNKRLTSGWFQKHSR